MIDAAEIAPLLDLARESVVLIRRRAALRPAAEILFANQALLELTGFDSARLVGRSIRVLRGAGMPRERFARLMAALTGDVEFSGRMSLALADGSDRFVTVRGTPIPGSEEHYALWFDATHARGTDSERVAAGERSLPAALGSECVYTMTVGSDCRLEIDWADERLALLTGYEPKELEAEGGLVELILPQDRVELLRRNQAVLAGRQASAEYRIRTRDGRNRWLSDTALPSFDDGDGLVSRIVCAVRDITHERGQVDPERLRERHAGLLAHALHALVAVVDISGRIRWASAEPATPLADLIRASRGKAIETILGPREVDEWLDWIEQAVIRQERASFRFQGTIAGEVATLDVMLSPLDEETALVVMRPPLRSGAPPAQPSGSVTTTLLDLLPDPALVLAADLDIVEANLAAAQLLGSTRTELRGQPFLDLLASESERAAMRRVLAQLAESGIGEAMTPALVMRGRAGPCWSLARIRDEQERTTGLLLQALPQQLEPDDALSGLFDDEPWLTAMLDSVADGIVTLRADGRIAWFSQAAAAIFGLDRGEAEGRGIEQLLTAGPNAEPGILKLLAEPGEPGRTVELFGRRRSGDVFPLEVAVTRLEREHQRLLVLAVRDITLRRQTEETLRNLAYLDPLTGLPNRLLFHDRLAQGIERARRNRQMLTVMLVDLDRFKLINDSLGLERGDQVLKAVGDRLVAVLRRSDTVARLGGDEFMLLLAATSSAEAAAKVAQKVLEALKPPLMVDAHELTIAASIGIAIYPYDGDDADLLIKNADSALSRAKEQGRNHYQFYTNDMNATAFERLMLESRLRKALEQGELVVYYQPQVSIASGRVTGFEALVRWFHPDLGMVPPGEFIPLAEETGLIVPIGELVLETACAEGKRLHDLGFPGLRVAVNLSARQFQQADLVDSIRRVVEKTGLPPTDLELELTESVIMRDAPESQRRLRELTALGIQLSIDDFGTGYSSLGYLRAFPIRSLKIDRSFIRDIDRDPNGAAITQAIIALSASLGLKVIAEGVETTEQLALLRAYGCQEMQGFLFSRPLPADELLALLREGRTLAGRTIAAD